MDHKTNVSQFSGICLKASRIFKYLVAPALFLIGVPERSIWQAEKVAAVDIYIYIYIFIPV